LVPISDKFTEEAEKMAQQMEAACVRVDIDERQMTLQKRVREAEMEWVPYVIVVGQKEIDSGVLQVRDRRTKGLRQMKLQELLKEVQKHMEGKPFKPLPLPKHLSKRPQFYG
jgi:threonyl-tRNA synthetase